MSSLYLSEEERRVSRASIARAVAEERIREGHEWRLLARRLTEEQEQLLRERQRKSEVTK